MYLTVDPETRKLLSYQAAIEGLSVEEATQSAIKEWCSKYAYLRTGTGSKRFCGISDDSPANLRCQR